jgi:regulator of RNase E activity RraA
VDLGRAFTGLVTCDLSDACDALGVAAYTTGAIRPVYQSCRPVAGRVVTVQLDPDGDRSTVIGTLEAIALAEPGSVLLFATGGRSELNAWGSIAATTAVQRRLAGVIIDGSTRDIQSMRELDFPAYARGTVVTSVKGRMGLVSINEEVRVDGHLIAPGAIAAADENGIIVFPADRAAEVFDGACAVAARERAMVQRIRHGADPIAVHHEARYEEPKQP